MPTQRQLYQLLEKIQYIMERDPILEEQLTPIYTIANSANE